ncbi:unnamed protein product [Spirodela intermedia]|uniref:Uncharacterized protein n=1 Tax=Spirodela intermedia TaxID=51605 RepID=A0A7I8L3I0_SPIIN|nr:unnamed protein product [Spirodela intermedia]
MGRQVVFGGCHLTEWKNGDFVATCLSADRPLPDDGLFLSKQSPFSRVYDHSLPHSRLATGDMKGEWRTRASIGPSQAA